MVVCRDIVTVIWPKLVCNHYIVMHTIWTPTLSGQGPLYRRLLEALRQAIQSGELPAGTRLPTHRALADRLDITPGTVTRAYHEAEQCGLLRARIGDGTYVRSTEEESQAPAWVMRQPTAGRIELWQNLPVGMDRSEAFNAAIAPLLQDPARINALMEYSPAEGNPGHRACTAEWLQQHGVAAHPDRLLFTYGAQNGLLLALLALGLAGQPLLCEGLTYPGLISLANSLKIPLRGLAMDEQGLLPEALEQACQQGHFRALYLIPTLHNPTTVTMPLARREAILAICARYQLWVIEDDVHGRLAVNPPPPLVNLAPERVICVGSLSKGSSAGLRLGYLLLPAALYRAATQAIVASSWMISPLLVEIGCRWMADGQANRLLQQQQTLLLQRGACAQQIMHGLDLVWQSGSMHAWLRLPEPWRAAALVAAAEQQGIGLAGAELFAAGHFAAPQAVRLSLSHPQDDAALRQALQTVRELLESGQSCAPLI